MPTPSGRMRRVNEAVREVLSAHIAGDLKDPRIGFVTVTAVDTSPDLRHARVFVSVLGDAAERQRTLDGLAAAHGFLQAHVGSELRMKRTPRLEFVYDESIERGARISELLSDGRPEEAQDHQDAGPDAPRRNNP
jgi:ribosome-binding factor A